MSPLSHRKQSYHHNTPLLALFSHYHGDSVGWNMVSNHLCRRNSEENIGCSQGRTRINYTDKLAGKRSQFHNNSHSTKISTIQIDRSSFPPISHLQIHNSNNNYKQYNINNNLPFIEGLQIHKNGHIDKMEMEPNRLKSRTVHVNGDTSGFKKYKGDIDKDDSSKNNSSMDNSSKNNSSMDNSSMDNGSKNNGSKNNGSMDNGSKNNSSKNNGSKDNSSKDNCNTEAADKISNGDRYIYNPTNMIIDIHPTPTTSNSSYHLSTSIKRQSLRSKLLDQEKDIDMYVGRQGGIWGVGRYSLFGGVEVGWYWRVGEQGGWYHRGVSNILSYIKYTQQIYKQIYVNILKQVFSPYNIFVEIPFKIYFYLQTPNTFFSHFKNPSSTPIIVSQNLTFLTYGIEESCHNRHTANPNTPTNKVVSTQITYLNNIINMFRQIRNDGRDQMRQKEFENQGKIDGKGDQIGISSIESWGNNNNSQTETCMNETPNLSYLSPSLPSSYVYLLKKTIERTYNASSLTFGHYIGIIKQIMMKGMGVDGSIGASTNYMNHTQTISNIYNLQSNSDTIKEYSNKDNNYIRTNNANLIDQSLSQHSYYVFNLIVHTLICCFSLQYCLTVVELLGIGMRLFGHQWLDSFVIQSEGQQTNLQEANKKPQIIIQATHKQSQKYQYCHPLLTLKRIQKFIESFCTVGNNSSHKLDNKEQFIVDIVRTFNQIVRNNRLIQQFNHSYQAKAAVREFDIPNEQAQNSINSIKVKPSKKSINSHSIVSSYKQLSQLAAYRNNLQIIKSLLEQPQNKQPQHQHQQQYSIKSKQNIHNYHHHQLQNQWQDYNTAIDLPRRFSENSLHKLGVSHNLGVSHKGLGVSQMLKKGTIKIIDVDDHDNSMVATAPTTPLAVERAENNGLQRDPNSSLQRDPTSSQTNHIDITTINLNDKQPTMIRWNNLLKGINLEPIDTKICSIRQQLDSLKQNLPSKLQQTLQQSQLEISSLKDLLNNIPSLFQPTLMSLLSLISNSLSLTKNILKQRQLHLEQRTKLLDIIQHKNTRMLNAIRVREQIIDKYETVLWTLQKSVSDEGQGRLIDQEMMDRVNRIFELYYERRVQGQHKMGKGGKGSKRVEQDPVINGENRSMSRGSQTLKSSPQRKVQSSQLIPEPIDPQIIQQSSSSNRKKLKKSVGSVADIGKLENGKNKDCVIY